MSFKYKHIVFLLFLTFSFFSCQETFLEIPDTSGRVDLEEVYSTAENARATLMNAYQTILLHGWPNQNAVGGALGSVGGVISRGYSFDARYAMVTNGLTVSRGTDWYDDNWSGIRKAFLVKENIDVVPDMDSNEKEWIKGEATALVAYRYMGMFYRYGGLPRVDHAFLPTDELDHERMSVQETLNYIMELCDEAIALLPDSWASSFYGRFTKGAAMAIKARTLQFAARPLFNSSTPYLSLGEHNDLISFGASDIKRWDTAIAASEAALSWSLQNGYELINTGGAGKGNPNPFENAAHDYGTATSTPGNKEVLLAYKVDEVNSLLNVYNDSRYNTNGSHYQMDLVGLLTNYLEFYRFRDGTHPRWPQVGDPSPTPASDWLDDKIPNMEARFRIDWITAGFESLANPNDAGWTGTGGGIGTSMNHSTNLVFPNVIGEGEGNAVQSKFYYKAGSRLWFEPPLFRVAELYLNLAEAYNESGNSQKALENLNMVRNRGGLPSATETDKTLLREMIWNEWAVEFNSENIWYFLIKHVKHPDIGTNLIGGPHREFQWQTLPDNISRPESLLFYWDAVVTTGMWADRMYLEPFPQDEVNKGFTVQNPGY